MFAMGKTVSAASNAGTGPPRDVTNSIQARKAAKDALAMLAQHAKVEDNGATATADERNGPAQRRRHMQAHAGTSRSAKPITKGAGERRQAETPNSSM